MHEGRKQLAALNNRRSPAVSSRPDHGASKQSGPPSRGIGKLAEDLAKARPVRSHRADWYQNKVKYPGLGWGPKAFNAGSNEQQKAVRGNIKAFGRARKRTKRYLIKY